MNDLHHQIADRVADGYWSVICVPDAEIPFAYTVGLTALGRPELLMTGPVPPTVLADLLNQLGQRHKVEALHDGQVIADLLFGALPVRVEAVPRGLALSEYAIQAGIHFEGVVDVLHIVLPDANGHLPGNRHCDPDWVRTQSLTKENT